MQSDSFKVESDSTEVERFLWYSIFTLGGIFTNAAYFVNHLGHGLQKWRWICELQDIKVTMVFQKQSFISDLRMSINENVFFAPRLSSAEWEVIYGG